MIDSTKSPYYIEIDDPKWIKKYNVKIRKLKLVEINRGVNQNESN